MLIVCIQTICIQQWSDTSLNGLEIEIKYFNIGKVCIKSMAIKT